MRAPGYKFKTLPFLPLLWESSAPFRKGPPRVPRTPELAYAVDGGIVTAEGKQPCEFANSICSKTQPALFAVAQRSNTNSSAKISAKNCSRRDFMEYILTSWAL